MAQTNEQNNDHRIIKGKAGREENDAMNAPPHRRIASTAPVKSKSHSPPPSSSDAPAHKLATINIKNGNGNSSTEKDSSKSKSSSTPKKQKSSTQVSRKISSAISKAITSTSSSATNSSSSSSSPEPIKYYLPQYLSNLVFPYHDEFYQSQCYDPHLIVQLMSEGFLPIATSRALLPKLHNYRCAIPPPLKTNVHISKSTRKKASRFALSINQNFDAIVAGCHAQHGISWLYPRIVAAFKYIFQQKDHTLNAMIFDDVYGRYPAGVFTPVRIHSVELWNVEKNTIVAGELGYTVGRVYTSLTGFSAEDSSGTVQLAALGVLLERCGFEMWDLGMGMEYKSKLGAVDVPKDDFLRVVRGSRVGHSHIQLKVNEKELGVNHKVDHGTEKKKGREEKPMLHGAGKINCRHIIDLWRQEQQQQQQHAKNNGDKKIAEKSGSATKKADKSTTTKEKGDQNISSSKKEKKKLKKESLLLQQKDQEESKSDTPL